MKPIVRLPSKCCELLQITSILEKSSLESMKMHCGHWLMLALSALHEFSRCHCVAICAGLVPINLLLSTAVIGLTMFNGSLALRRWLSIGGALACLLLLSHVGSWWLIGVVAPATFILPSLGLLCSAINWACLHYPVSTGQFWRSIVLHDWKASSL